MVFTHTGSGGGGRISLISTGNNGPEIGWRRSISTDKSSLETFLNQVQARGMYNKEM